jgi:hypothetical protein
MISSFVAYPFGLTAHVRQSISDGLASPNIILIREGRGRSPGAVADYMAAYGISRSCNNLHVGAMTVMR